MREFAGTIGLWDMEVGWFCVSDKPPLANVRSALSTSCGMGHTHAD